MVKLRLQKYLSQNGICSRRKAEEYIKEKLIKVNGDIAHIGQIIDSDIDQVKLLNKAIKKQQEYIYYIINKPRGIETTCAQKGGKSIIDIINIKQRVFPIGRLDKDTTGLILLTNDGRLANYLMHPRYEHEKEYIVETFGKIEDTQLQKMRNGLFILGSYTKKAIINRISSGKFSIIITEGRNRQIRRMVEKVGSKVKRLKRIRIENIKLQNLNIGEYRELKNIEKTKLFNKLGIK